MSSAWHVGGGGRGDRKGEGGGRRGLEYKKVREKLTLTYPVLRSRLTCKFFTSPYSAKTSIKSSSEASSCTFVARTIHPSTERTAIALVDVRVSDEVEAFLAGTGELAMGLLWASFDGGEEGGGVEMEGASTSIGVDILKEGTLQIYNAPLSDESWRL